MTQSHPPHFADEHNGKLLTLRVGDDEPFMYQAQCSCGWKGEETPQGERAVEEGREHHALLNRIAMLERAAFESRICIGAHEVAAQVDHPVVALVYLEEFGWTGFCEIHLGMNPQLTEEHDTVWRA